MPLSKCRRCGKSVPNPYRPYHERVACLELKRQKGLLFGREIPHRTDRAPRKELPEGQRRLLSFGVVQEKRRALKKCFKCGSRLEHLFDHIFFCTTCKKRVFKNRFLEAPPTVS